MGFSVSKKSVFLTSFGVWPFSREFFYNETMNDLQICEKFYDVRFMLC